MNKILDLQSGKHSTFHVAYLWYINPTSFYIEMQHFSTLTMATSEPDPNGFQLVITSKTSKKAKTTPMSAPCKKLEIETDVHMIFQLPQNHCGTFNPTNKMKLVITKMMRYDPSLSIHSLTKDNALFPEFDKFPMKKQSLNSIFWYTPSPNDQSTVIKSPSGVVSCLPRPSVISRKLLPTRIP